MAEKKVYVLDDGANQYEAMTREQIIAAITQAVNDGTISDIDAGFITKIQEMNKKGILKWWVGTQAEFNALETKDSNTLYLFTDDPLYQDIINALTEMEEKLLTQIEDKIGSRVEKIEGSIENINETLSNSEARARTLVTENRAIVSDVKIVDGFRNGTGITYNPISINVSNSEIIANENKILYSLHLDLKFGSQQGPLVLQGDHANFGSTSLDIPFQINSSISGSNQDYEITWLNYDGANILKTIIIRNVDCDSSGFTVAEYELLLKIEWSKAMQFSSFITLKITPTGCTSKGTAVIHGGQAQDLEFDDLGYITVTNAYVERIGAKTA